MLSLPDHPVLDKHRILGGCVRLPLTLDALRLRAEFEDLPDSLWGGTGGRVGVHRAAQAVFLRGYAPIEGERPIEDRPPLQLLPLVREFIGALVPAPALRCLLAKLPAGVVIATHVDQADYFSKTIRLHVPIVTNDQVVMYCAGKIYRMQPGEVWALNNSARHGVWNAHAEAPRTHLICDFLPTPALLDLLRRGDAQRGQVDSAIETFLAKRDG
ncbi:MAG TPA: aspartyl/asparaginyl beta-hydroxylase domain-containing protein [Nevskia sp.]|nr:aspartyl/asparaginyl beta-hydroxylase domain-containing protein [Nevskia sp.]